MISIFYFTCVLGFHDKLKNVRYPIPFYVFFFKNYAAILIKYLYILPCIYYVVCVVPIMHIQQIVAKWLMRRLEGWTRYLCTIYTPLPEYYLTL